MDDRVSFSVDVSDASKSFNDFALAALKEGIKLEDEEGYKLAVSMMNSLYKIPSQYSFQLPMSIQYGSNLDPLIRYSFIPDLMPEPEPAPDEDFEGFSNPYLEHFLCYCQKNTDSRWEFYESLGFIEGWKIREKMVEVYSWSVPSEEAIEAIANLSKSTKQIIVEVFSGNGYWANMIREAGGSIVASDNFSWAKEKGRKFPEVGKSIDASPEDGYYYRIFNMEADHAASMCSGMPNPDGKKGIGIMLMVWPPYMEDSGLNAAKEFYAYGGKHLILVSEGMGGCVGSDELFEFLEEKFDVEKMIALPNWPGVHDNLLFYKRKPSKEELEEIENLKKEEEGRKISMAQYSLQEIARIIREDADRVENLREKQETFFLRGQKIDSLRGKKIALTGKISVPMKAAVKFLDSLGAEVTSSVTGKTDILISTETDTKKIRDALRMGIEILSETKFIFNLVPPSCLKCSSPLDFNTVGGGFVTTYCRDCGTIAPIGIEQEKFTFKDLINRIPKPVATLNEKGDPVGSPDVEDGIPL